MEKEYQLDGTTSSSRASTTCNHECLMRYTDDYLFISTDLKKATSFADKMHIGMKGYGCSINSKKSRVNFPYFDPTTKMQVTQVVDHTLWWCGVLLTFPMTGGMHIGIDYARDILLMQERGKSCVEDLHARALEDKMVNYLIYRLHPLFFDNSLQSIICITVRFA